ncbi:DUF3429 domain-containing protein [Fodinicurvata sp. EGI_FJ10296]|uniref:DUF3429 domain-containing protein n=1 Tax=Fodinicurvata sp. EGI_FJ10296 TaxID=3231908 RepID=UPI003455FD21
MLLKRVPTPALALGFAGLLPFFAIALAIWLSRAAEQSAGWAGYLLSVQIAYAAIIASFVGAVQWGLAMSNMGWEHQRSVDRDRLNDGGDGQRRYEPAVRQMIFSVVPALIGWALVLLFQLIPSRAGALVVIMAMAILFVACYMADARSVRYGLAPEWYGELRAWLTGGVLFALTATAFAVI